MKRSKVEDVSVYRRSNTSGRLRQAPPPSSDNDRTDDTYIMDTLHEMPAPLSHSAKRIEYRGNVKNEEFTRMAVEMSTIMVTWVDRTFAWAPMVPEIGVSWIKIWMKRPSGLKCRPSL